MVSIRKIEKITNPEPAVGDIIKLAKYPDEPYGLVCDVTDNDIWAVWGNSPSDCINKYRVGKAIGKCNAGADGGILYSIGHDELKFTIISSRNPLQKEAMYLISKLRLRLGVTK